MNTLRRSLGLGTTLLASMLLLVAGLSSPAGACDDDGIALEPCFTGREDTPRSRLRFAGCERLQRERDGYCLTTIDDQPTVVGLSSGTRCTVETQLGFQAKAFAWRGEAVYFCTDDIDGTVARGSLLDGNVVEFSTIQCSSVTDHDGGILVRDSLLGLPFEGFVYSWYRDLDSLAADDPQRQFTAVVWDTGPIATSGALLLSAWHSTDTIHVADLQRERQRNPITLEGFDDWVDGLAATSDGRIVVLGGGAVIVFRANGRRIKAIALAEPPFAGRAAGLACFSGTTSGISPQRLATIRREPR